MSSVCMRRPRGGTTSWTGGCTARAQTRAWHWLSQAWRTASSCSPGLRSPGPGCRLTAVRTATSPRGSISRRSPRTCAACAACRRPSPASAAGVRGHTRQTECTQTGQMLRQTTQLAAHLCNSHVLLQHPMLPLGDLEIMCRAMDTSRRRILRHTAPAGCHGAARQLELAKRERQCAKTGRSYGRGELRAELSASASCA